MLLADISSRFVNVAPDELDGAIGEAQRQVCECLRLDLSGMWQRSAERADDFRMTHLYRPLGGPTVPDTMDARDFFPWVMGEVMAGRDVCFTSVEETPPEAERDREVWRHFDLRSILCIPLMVGGGEVLGALAFNSQGRERSWPIEVVQRLKIVARVFAGALERKRADAELRESEERLQLAAESADVGMWMLDLTTGRFWANDRGRAIFGYPADVDVTMELFVHTVRPEDREPVTEAIRQAVEEGSDIDIEYRIVLPDGDERWIHSRGRVRPPEPGKPPRMLGTSVDVTERRKAEEALRRSLAEVERLKSQLELGERLPEGSTSSASAAGGSWRGPAIIDVLGRSSRSHRPRAPCSSRARPGPARS
jgi:PAS domain S-box-containing protein